MTQQIAIREVPEGVQSIQDLENSFAIAVRQRELLEKYIKDRLTPGKHFYQIQGSKNSLTKEGAELICLPHGYKPAYFKEAGPDQPPDDSLDYQITVRCRLMRGDVFAGEGIGSANSHVTRKDGERVPRQPDIGLRHNATLKMAQKSAYIAATLNATAASEFFTQDMEEDQAGSGGAGETQPPKNNRYRCPEHGVDWTKRTGKDGSSWYSHKNGAAWCNMQDYSREEKAVRGEPVEEPPATETSSDWVKLYAWAKAKWDMAPVDIHFILGASANEWQGTMQEAQTVLLDAQNEAAKAG